MFPPSRLLPGPDGPAARSLSPLGDEAGRTDRTSPGSVGWMAQTDFGHAAGLHTAASPPGTSFPMTGGALSAPSNGSVVASIHGQSGVSPYRRDICPRSKWMLVASIRVSAAAGDGGSPSRGGAIRRPGDLDPGGTWKGWPAKLGTVAERPATGLKPRGYPAGPSCGGNEADPQCGVVDTDGGAGKKDAQLLPPGSSRGFNHPFFKSWRDQRRHPAASPKFPHT